MIRTTTIHATLDNIDAVRRYLREYEWGLDSKLERLKTALAQVGVQEASLRFMTAVYDGEKNISVYSVRETGKVLVCAEGAPVAFIEFGAGVFYNSDGSYPLKRPAGIAGIGGYGKGYGKRPAWGYYDESHVLNITRGTPAAMPMYYASRGMKDRIIGIAKEVFASD